MSASRRIPGRLISAPRLAAVVATFAAIGLVLAVALLGDPFKPLARSTQLGWVPEAWSRPLAGHWHASFERSEFVPCPGLAGGVDLRAGERWWADWEEERRERIEGRIWAPGAPRRDTVVFVAWYADVSPRGAWGHLGHYSRELDVRAVAAVGEAAPGACEAALRDPTLFAVE